MICHFVHTHRIRIHIPHMNKISHMHPLATLHWEEFRPYCGNSIVILKDKVYIYSNFLETMDSDLYCAPLTDLENWSTLTTPPDVCYSTLTTYQSQLVLVGGENSRGEDTNKLWVSADGNNWHQSLPPLSRYRCGSVMALGCASPECLIISGGDHHSTMEVLIKKQWFSIPVPSEHLNTGLTHNGTLYLYNRWSRSGSPCYYCSVKSVLTTASCSQTTEDLERVHTLWKTIELPPHGPNIVLLSFQQHLIAVAFIRNVFTVYVYSARSKSWVFMDENRQLKTFVLLVAATYSDQKDHLLICTSALNGIYRATLQGASLF